MKLAVTTNGRLYKTPEGHYYTQVVYRYDFFLRYLEVFEKVRLIAHCEEIGVKDVANMVRVDGPNLEIYEVPFPHGKIGYIKKYLAIKSALCRSLDSCDAALLRIPDELAFQLYAEIKKQHLPLAVEVTSDPWMLFKKGNTSDSFFRPFIRLHWHHMQKKICREANGTSYVTREYLQHRYPPSVGENFFTTNYTNAEIDETWLDFCSGNKENECSRLIHVATSISGNAKGHRELLSAAGILLEQGNKVEVALVGAGELNSDCKAIVAQYHLEPYLRLLGRLTKEQLKEELSKADIFVFPSYVEGLPRVVVEAMGMGLPCVATDLPGIVELLGEEWCVPVQDAMTLASKVKTLLADSALAKSVGKHNREVAKDFSLPVIKERRNSFYTKLRLLAIKKS